MAQHGKKAVVGADFGASGDDAIAEGLRFLGHAADNVLHVVHVLDPDDVIDDADQAALVTEEQVLERAPALLRERLGQVAFLNALPYPAERVFTHARIGKAVETLEQVAVDYDADLLIVGTHGRRGIDRLVLGSVAERLVRTAHCPVLVARRKDYSTDTKTPALDAPYAPGQEPKHGRTQADVEDHIRTERDSWEPAGGDPTGIRIV